MGRNIASTRNPAYNPPMLISEPIEVEMRGGALAMKQPAAFVWRGRRYEITRVLDFWFDTGFGAQQRGKRWWMRRHRNVYRVEADDGHIYELYLDRGGKQFEWHLYRRLDDDESDTSPPD